MAATKYSVSAYTADGVTTDYLITWDYLDNDHIAVYVDGKANYDPTSTYTFELLNSTTVRVTDEFGNAVPAGAEIEVRRETPVNTRAVTFNDGSALLAEDLNKNSDYLLYSMQEVLDTVEAAAQDGALAAQVATEILRDETTVLRDTTLGYKNEALAARDTTQTYLATVDADATAADNHRIAAAASEAAALASKNAAAASQAASATSEANAAASEAASAASEAAAAVSEAAALASKNAAATSEANAATSETAAQTAQAAAEAALDELTDLYLGAKAVVPSVDNDGNALQTGALYWNTVSDIMYVWNGSAWDTFNSTTGIADGATSAKVTLTDTSMVVDVDVSVSGNITAASGSNYVKTDRFLNNHNLGTNAANAANHFTQTNTGSAPMSTGWISAAYGDTTAPRVVLGQAAGQAIVGAHNGDITAWDKLTLRGAGLEVRNDAGNQTLSIDNSGRLSLPYAPAVAGYATYAQWSQSAGWYVLRLNALFTNRGSHYNTANGRFTCPVGGVYSVTATMLGGNGPDHGSIAAWRNGASLGCQAHFNYNGAANGWHSATTTTLISCNAGDYIELMWQTTGNAYVYLSGGYTHGSIHYLG